MSDSQVIALDVSEQRLSRIKENLVRLGLRAELIAADASHTESWWDQHAFDAVLLDLPCCNWGDSTTSRCQTDALGNVITIINWNANHDPRCHMGILEIPDSVANFSEAMLAKANIRSLKDISLLVPNLYMTTRLDGFPNVSMRGMGGFGNTQGVGFYLDDVQLFADQTSRFGDLSRIEVLKGP